MNHELTVELLDVDGDPEQIEALTQNLRQDLLELDVESVSLAPGGEAPPGSKGLDLAAINALVVSMSASAALATKVVSVIRSWLRRGQPVRTLKLTVGGRTLELSAASEAQQQELVDEFVKAMSKG